MKATKLVLFLLLLQVSVMAQFRPPSGPVTLKYRQGNSNTLNMIVASAGQVITPSASTTLTAEIRVSEAAQVLRSLPLQRVDTTEFLSASLPDLAPTRYVMNLKLAFAGGRVYRSGICYIEIVPAGSIISVPDVTGLNVTLDMRTQVLDIKLDSGPAVALVQYYAELAKQGADAVAGVDSIVGPIGQQVAADRVLAQQARQRADSSAGVAVSRAATAEQMRDQAQIARNQTQVLRDSASIYRNQAATSRTNALQSENNAKGYRDATLTTYQSTTGVAAQVQNNATTVGASTTLVQELAAQVRQDRDTVAAKTVQAKQSASRASTSEQNAFVSETNAGNSANQASQSKTSAGNSQTAAAASAGTATTQAGIATQKAGEAVTSAGQSTTNLNGAILARQGAEAALAAMAGGIADKSVTPGKTTFFNASKNLFNSFNSRDGYFLGNTNVEQANPTYGYSDYISVSPGLPYSGWDGAQGMRFVCYYDANKTLVAGGASSTVSSFTAPAGVAFIRVTFTLTRKSTFQFEQATSPTPFASYGHTFNTGFIPDASIAGTKLNSQSVSIEKVNFLIASKNLFVKKTATVGAFINWANGQLQANAAYWYSDYISIAGGAAYVQSNETHLAFYDSGKTFISGYQAGTGFKTFTSPANAAYIRVSYTGGVTVDNYQLEVGTTSTSYVLGGYSFSDAINAPSSPTVTATTNVWQGKVFSSIGTSITAAGTYQSRVASALSITYNNYGVGGTKVVDVSGSDTTAICRPERINKIAANSDVITFEGGTNDWAQNIQLGNVTDTVTTTFYGALYQTFKRLQTRFPSKRIVALATPFGKFPNRAGWTNTYGLVNNLGLRTSDYGKCVIDMARLFGFPVIDLHGRAGINDMNVATYLTNDGAYLHHNNAGATRYANLITSDFIYRISPD